MNRPRHGILLVTGSHTHQEGYAAAFAADPRCRLVGVTDEADVSPRRRKLNEELARKLGIPHLPSLDDALARADVDAVSVCTEPERRGRVALRCARAGKHLYLDKTLVPRLEEADALVAEVKKRKLLSHMFCFITQPWAQEARRLVTGGMLGTLQALHSDVYFAKGRNGTATLGSPRKEEYPPQRHQLMEAKREWDNVGVYAITFLHWLTGKPFRSLFGLTGNYFFAEHQKHDVEDFGLLCGTLEGDLPVTISAGRYGWTTHPAFGHGQTVIVGSKRTIVVGPHQPRLEVFTDEAPWAPPAKPHPEDPMAFWASTQEESGVRPKRTYVPAGPSGERDAAYFLDCLDEGKESEMSVVQAAHATEVLLATYLSASKGEMVRLPLPR